jgi:hypothetical protein
VHLLDLAGDLDDTVDPLTRVREEGRIFPGGDG